MMECAHYECVSYTLLYKDGTVTLKLFLRRTNVF